MRKLKLLLLLGFPFLAATCGNSEPKEKEEQPPVTPPPVTVTEVRAAQPVRIVCIGNSITAGYSNSSEAMAWPGQLNGFLGSGYSVRNCGVSGTTMFRGLDESYWKTTRFETAKSLDPQILIIALGTNDSHSSRWNTLKGQFKTDYLAMVEEFRKDGRDPVIYVCFPPPLFGTAKADQNNSVKDNVIPIVREIAGEIGAHIIDFNEPLTGYSSAFPDGVHPNDEGARLMAVIAHDKIKTAQQAIQPVIEVEKGEVTENTIVALEEGGSVSFEMLPAEGTWKWTGSDGFTSNARTVEFKDVKKGGIYTAIHTNAEGKRSIVNFLVSVVGKRAAGIVPYVKDRNGNQSQTGSIITNPGTTITLIPQTTGTNDTWSWSGPQGLFSFARELRLEEIGTSQAGIYTVVYTEKDGSQSSKDFNVTVAGELVCPTLTSHINYGGWQQVTEMDIPAGASVQFGPHPVGGNWKWEGPDGFTSNDRAPSVSNFSSVKAGEYIATYTNNAGCKVLLVVTLRLK